MALEEKEETLVNETDPSGEESNQETIDFSEIDLDAIAELSNEDLEKAIAEIDAGEEGEEGQGAEQGDAQAGEEEPPPKDSPEPNEYAEEVERLRKQNHDKEQFIQDRNRMIGDLRRQLELALSAQERVPRPPLGDEEEDSVMKEAFFRDPVGTMEKLLAEKASRAQLKTTVLQTEVKEAIPNIEELRDDIATMALEDGWERNAIEHFRTNLAGDVPVIKAYAARVKMAKELKMLQAERDTLQRKLEELPKEILKKIDSAAKRRPHLSAKGGDSGGGDLRVDENTLPDLSDEDLDRVLAKMKEGEH